MSSMKPATSREVASPSTERRPGEGRDRPDGTPARPRVERLGVRRPVSRPTRAERHQHPGLHLPQMIAVAGMAVYVASAAGEGGAGFALSYASITWCWPSCGTSPPATTPNTVRRRSRSPAVYAASALFSRPRRPWRCRPASSSGGSADVGDPDPDIGGPPGSRRSRTAHPWAEHPRRRAHRWSQRQPPPGTRGPVHRAGGDRRRLHLVWIYFDLVSRLRPIPARSAVWANLHFFVIAGMAGWAAVVTTVRHADEAFPRQVHWLLVGSMALTFLALAGLMAVLEIRQARRREYDRGIALLLATASSRC
jgi:hypothetical protein